MDFHKNHKKVSTVSLFLVLQLVEIAQDFAAEIQYIDSVVYYSIFFQEVGMGQKDCDKGRKIL